MLNLRLPILRLSFLLLTVSCRPQILDTLDLELPSKLVVGCNLIVESNSLLQQDSLYLHLAQSAPLFGSSEPEDSVLTDAVVQLFRQRPGQAPQAGDTLNNFSITALGSPIEGNNLYYAAPTQIAGQSFVQKGYTYSLRVSSKDGRTVNASAAIPVSEIADTNLQILVTSPDEWSRNLQVKVRWRSMNEDPSGSEPAHFRINYRVTGIFQNSDYWNNADLTGYPNQLVSMNASNNGVYEWQDRFNFYLPFDTTGLANAQLEVAIQRINQPLYQYLQAIGQQGLSEDNPFGEPVVIPTNIQGGLGCLGTMITYRMRRSIPW